MYAQRLAPMKVIYLAAWLVIAGFLVWSGNLLLNIQSLWSQSNVLHTLRTDLDALTGAWRDLSRPGNDVLENYEVAPQRAVFEDYARRYQAARDVVLRRIRDNPGLAPFIDSLEAQRQTLSGLAREILQLAQQREELRLGRGGPESIRTKETLATSKMARMDQAFQDGLDQLLKANEAVIAQEQALEAVQHRNFHRLYVMLLFALVASALSVELVRRTMRQREALREGAARINAIVNNVVDGIVTVDEQGRIESINPTASAMFGYPAGELMGRAFTQLLDESCRDSYRERLGQGAQGAARTFGAQECEALGRRRDGSSFPMELAASQVLVEGRRLAIHIVRDITERRRADERLRLAASVFENTTEGILVTDARGIIQSVNPAFTTITQYRAQEVIGRNPSLLKSGRQDRGFYRRMWASIRDTGHWQGEIWNRRKNGEVYPQWLTISAIKDAQGRVSHYVGVTWDISELKASERLKEEFIATVSHELRTPLTSVLGSLGLIVGEVAGEVPERVQKLVRIAYHNSERLVRLISDILDIEKMEAGKMGFRFQPLELMPLVRQATEANRAYAEQCGVDMVVTRSPTGVRVNGDADRLSQVLTNLLSNAAKFSHAGDRVEVAVVRHHGMIRISVTDHGPGIREGFRAQVFEKFAQADASDTRRKGGTGLGLSIAKLIVEQHGGRIGFTSEPGVRTTFHVDLPEFQAQPATATSSPRTTAGESRGPA